MEADLVPGSGGIFVVAVDGKTVAEKGLTGFPSEQEVVKAVSAALKR